ncbi:kinase-like domain-containing protein [Rhizophagus clarus]|uniref:Kinase-like domain-containing protein n=1 Tax=Rhizophagus clarus TaxID=94130 RepID=A0A8H3M4A3_9GLOM|nr:kinase-like domain-containing protein [Rhizophagus clarus]
MSLIQLEQTSKRKSNIFRKCNECNRKRKTLDENHQICHVCYKIKKFFKSSGNKVIDDFIRHTQVNYALRKSGKIEIVPYNQFKNIEFIAEGGFSKIYKATWVDGPIGNWDMIKSDDWKITRYNNNYTVVLKRLSDSKNITSKELNELKVFCQIYSNIKYRYAGDNISNYFGITQDPITNDIIIIMPYYNSDGSYIGDLGISKSATECTDNNNENYELIIKICDGLRPQIVTNAPEGYVELMKECWHSDPEKRPTAPDLRSKVRGIWNNEEKNFENNNPTKIIKSLDIGPVSKNNPGAIYKSRPLSHMIQSAISLRNSRSLSIDPFYYYQRSCTISIDKRKFDDNSVDGIDDNDQSIKKRKLFENEKYDYFTKEIELYINKSSKQSQNNEYITKEFDIDINNLV